MPGLTPEHPEGVLRSGWSAVVGDYAIACGWAGKGTVLVVGDVAGGVYGFVGTTGAVRWQQPKVHEGGLLAMAIAPGGERFATGGQDGRLRIWSAAEGEVIRNVEVGGAWVENVAWSSDGHWLAVSCGRRVYVYNRDGDRTWSSEDHPSTVAAIAWSGAKELATACYGRVSFLDAVSGECRQKLEWKGSLVSMVLSSDGDVVACGSQDNSVHFWRRSTGQDSMMAGYPGKPSSLAFDAAGMLLATGGGPSVTVWSFHGDGPEGTRPGVLELHVQPVTCLAFATRGHRLASGSRDGSVVVWGVAASGEGGVLGVALMKDVVAGLAWRPDGRALATLDASGGVTVWRVQK